jgi:hypothetical protein
LAALAAAAYLLWPQDKREPASAQRPETPAQPATVAPIPPSTEPKVAAPARHPIEDVQQPTEPPPVAVTAPEAPLPPSAEGNEATLLKSLSGLLGFGAVTQLLQSTDLVRHFVATVDNLPREKVAARLVPVQPPPGPFKVSSPEDVTTLSPDNYARYDAYVRLTEAVDAKRLVALYVRSYPLFQQAYRDLGYPSGHFNDRLVEAIDDALAAPGVNGPVKLTRAHVLYQFEDPKLESRSAGQKLMIRMGDANAARVKSKLEQIRRLLVKP